MVITLGLVNSHLIYVQWKERKRFLLVMRTQLYSVNNFVLYHTAVLAIVIMLNISVFLVLIYLVTRIWYVLTLSTPPTPPLLLVTTNQISFLRVWCSEFWGCFTDSTCKWNHAVFVLVWLISFSIMSLRFIHVVTNCRIFSFYGWIIFHCMYKSQFYPFIHQQTSCCLILAIVDKILWTQEYRYFSELISLLF